MTRRHDELPSLDQQLDDLCVFVSALNRCNLVVVSFAVVVEHFVFQLFCQLLFEDRNDYVQEVFKLSSGWNIELLLERCIFDQVSFEVVPHLVSDQYFDGVVACSHLVEVPSKEINRTCQIEIPYDTLKHKDYRNKHQQLKDGYLLILFVFIICHQTLELRIEP